MMKHTLKFISLLVLLHSVSASAVDAGKMYGPLPMPVSLAQIEPSAGEVKAEELKPADIKEPEKAVEEKTDVKIDDKAELKPDVVEPLEVAADSEPKVVRKNSFFDDKKPNDNYKKAMKFLSEADENGLNRVYFDTTEIAKRVEKEDPSSSYVAKTDSMIYKLVSEMIQQIGNGHKIPAELKLETYFERPVRVTNPSAAVQEFLKSDNPEEVVEKYQPKNPQYALIRKALAKYIEEHKDRREIKPIEYSGDLVIGDKHYTISDIRTRVGGRRSIDPKFEADEYDKLLATKVKEFQEKFDMEQNGVITKEFIEKLNGHDDDYVSRLKTNMERYRWLQDELPETRLMVNMPSFNIIAYKDGEKDFEMGAIVGYAAHKTPIMSTRMYQFHLNPYWTAPKAYFLRNMLPLLKVDPNYVKNQNFDLMQMTKDGWKKIDQSSVNWEKVTPENYNFLLRQRPGNLNVLGPIKFAINNPYDIFIHFTSEPWLFTNKSRGYSSGCIRIEDPVKLAKFVIEEGGADITEERFLELFNYYTSKDGIALPQKQEMNDRVAKLKTAIPTFTTYFTAVADEDGNITFFDDSYNLDFDMGRLLGL